jgi:hypothetical protein
MTWKLMSGAQISRMSRLSACALLIFQFALVCWAQKASVERKFPQSKATVEKALQNLKSTLAGRLPTLDGFADAGQRSLDRFQRGYYQCEVKVVPSPSGGVTVEVNAKITAWYVGTATADSGYQTLNSNGRIENDLLDQLSDLLASKQSASADVSSSRASKPAPLSAESAKPANPIVESSAPAPKISAPLPYGSELADAIAASRTRAATAVPPSGPGDVASLQTQHAVADKHIEDLTATAKNLEEIIHNQAHPTNLAAVKNGGAKIFSTPNESSKVLFQATAEDEFEILDTTANWVHIRISGLSRGWILRSRVELSDSSSAPSENTRETAQEPAKKDSAATPSVPAFQVSNEQTASFPGSWAPLQGKVVRIISVEESADKTTTGAHAKLEFAKSLLGKEYGELAQGSSAAGIVLIFDAEDGGMMAATLPVLQQWKAGSLSDEALWRRCFFDPPEMAGLAANR